MTTPNLELNHTFLSNTAAGLSIKRIIERSLTLNLQWDRSVPGGEGPGMLTNYTQDLLFSMERLSLNPYPLRRLKISDSLPFQISSSIVYNLTTAFSLEALKFNGRLFVVDRKSILFYSTL